MKRLLFIPPEKWYVEAHAEYIIRYLSDEFFIEIGQAPYPPFSDIHSRFPEVSPFMRSPEDYDLLWPMLPTHWQIPYDGYAHKSVTVFYCPNEGRHTSVADIGATTPIVEDSLDLEHKHFHSLRFGIDTNLFTPYDMGREDDLLHVGYIGTHINPRHMVKDVVMKVADIPGVRLMIFPTSWINNGGDINQVGGQPFLDHVVTGDKYWPGLPNIYNRLDVLLRMDQDPAYSFPTLEAGACGVPVIATNSGIDHLITGAGGGILIDGNREYYMNHTGEVADKVRDAVIWMRDHKKERQEMGKASRAEIEKNWTWEKCIPAWRDFFEHALTRI